MDSINRSAWARPDTVRLFRNLDGYTDPGERAALANIEGEVRGRRILDIGVGGGRTVPLLRRISDDYLAVDYTPELVDACRARHPGVRVLAGDARDLSMIEDESVGLAVFSFNGIDAVTHEDRARVLAAVHRVLAKDGVFLFSTHNRRGPGYGESLHFGFWLSKNPITLGARLLRSIAHAPQTLRNRRRYGTLGEEGDDYGIRNASAHDHGILVHYITLEGEARELERAGFDPHVRVYSSRDGRLVQPGEDTSRDWWFHIVTRKVAHA
jgi:SAM-dependent methyltransferase